MPIADASSSAYLYIVTLDGPGRAWEYLRRNAGYRRDASRSDGTADDRAPHWGLRFRRGS